MRTDMAIERHEELNGEEIPGVNVKKTEGEGWLLTEIQVASDEASRRLQKPRGTYYTMETDAFPDIASLTGETMQSLSSILSGLLPESGTVLVVGLGNLNVTPDALGPKCADMVFATRHIDEGLIETLSLPNLRSVAVLSPGVTGQTGMEASFLTAGVCEKLKPSAVIAVDALAAGSVKRLGNNIQVSSAGIEPGSGVGNSRKALSYDTLGVPVVSVGVPTVVDALTLAGDVTGEAQDKTSSYGSMMVTPRDIDTVIDSAARLLALSINVSLQKNMSPEELLSLM